jgi:hypothetical protein
MKRHLFPRICNGLGYPCKLSIIIILMVVGSNALYIKDIMQV